jgi:hypothetical protein
MPTVSATGTTSWPGAVYNGQTFTMNVTYNWTSNTACSVSVSFSGGCGGSAGSDGAAYQQNYSGWGVGTCQVNGSNKITGMFIYYRVQSYPGAGYTNYTWSGTVSKSSSFLVKYN